MKIDYDYAKIYSPYKLGMFSRCPRSYHFFYLDPMYSRMKNELKKHPDNIWKFHTLGKAVHNAITLLYYLPPHERTEKRLLENLKGTWRSEVMWDKKPPLGQWGGFTSIDEERDSYREAISMLRNFLKVAEIEPKIEYLPTENFQRSIDDYNNLIVPLSTNFDISGRFDLIIQDSENSLHIVDFKTGKSEDDNNFQLRFYKLLAEENFGKSVKKASFYFLKIGNKKEFDLGREETEEIKQEILVRIDQIKATKNFVTRPSRLCKFCLFRGVCPEKEQIAKITKDVSEEDYSDDLPF